jgi:hypothetical protein
LEVNTSISKFFISGYSTFQLNLHSIESLRFIEKNSSIKELDLSFIQFNEIESKFLGECLMKNNSITSLDLSESNFKGSFDFLRLDKLKSCTFTFLFSEIDFKGFLENLKLNTSLKKLDIALKYLNEDSNFFFHNLIDILSEHSGNIEDLSFNGVIYPGKPIEFHKLLKNSKIQKLSLVDSIEISESFEKILKGLSDNNTLLHLDISGNLSEYESDDLNDVQFSNSSIEFFNIAGESFL